jgi:hypothetical protein
MSDLTAAGVGAAVASFLILICISEIGMREKPKPSSIIRTLELFVGVFTLATIVLTAYWGTLHKPYVPTWVNQLCLGVTVLLFAWDLLIAICASNIAITKRPPKNQ